jgi:hypothetical protein
MKKLTGLALNLLGLAALALLAAVLIWVFETQGNGSSSPLGSQVNSAGPSPTTAIIQNSMTPLLPPTPDLSSSANRGASGLTPTPNPSALESKSAAPAISATPWPISATVDLAPTIPAADKATVYVQLANGTQKRFLISSDMDPSKLPLQPGDKILLVAPPQSLMGIQIHPQTQTVSPPSMPALSTPGYPAPLAPTRAAYP